MIMKKIKTKKRLSARQGALGNIKNTYCRLRSSKISGIGVFAVRDIPAGTKLFRGVRPQKWYRFKAAEFANADFGVRQMVDDFFVVEKDGTVLVPRFGLDGMDISVFLNHSKRPNAETRDEGFTFVAKRRIRRGEEVTVDYGIYDYKYR